MSRHVVATVDEIKPGHSKLVTVKGREIGLFNVNGRFHALANRCPHAGGALCQGEIVGLPQSAGPGDYRIVRRARRRTGEGTVCCGNISSVGRRTICRR
jgi:hypothetical protein